MDFRYVKLPESTFLAKETTGELISNLIANEVHLCSNQEHDLASRGFPDPFPFPSFPILHKKARYVGAASLLVGGQYRSICSPSSNWVIIHAIFGTYIISHVKRMETGVLAIMGPDQKSNAKLRWPARKHGGGDIHIVTPKKNQIERKVIHR